MQLRHLGARLPYWEMGKKSLNTRDWSVAAATVHEWEAARVIGGKRKEIPTIKDAISKYLEDSEARHLAAPTIRKRRELLEGKLLPFCQSKGYERLADLNVDTLRNSQDVEVRRDIGGQATRILTRIPAVLRGIRMD
jgi:hypothetical protein